PPRPPPSPRPAPSPPPAPPGSRLTWRPPPTPLSPPLPPPGPGQRAFPSTATCAPYTPRGSASTPLAVSPCTTIPVTALIGSTTGTTPPPKVRSEEHTSELQSRFDLVCRLLLEKNN